jgi:hypothetical protein
MSSEYFRTRGIFVERLYEILAEQEHSGCISWSEDGSSFIIKNKEALESKVLGLFYKSASFSK